MNTSLSIIIPVYNEEGNIGLFVDSIRALHPEAEIVVVDDGSTDNSLLEIDSDVRTTCLSISHQGQSHATYQGLMQSSGDICVVVDGDGQSNPRDISVLVEKLSDFDVVFGRRKKVGESFSRRCASWFAFVVRAIVFNDPVKDPCGPKALRRSCLPHLIVFDGMHRFMSVLFGHAGMRICEIPVSHYPRKYGHSKYTVSGRAMRGIRDVMRVRKVLSHRVMLSKHTHS